jgi:hypothetical protein
MFSFSTIEIFELSFQGILVLKWSALGSSLSSQKTHTLYVVRPAVELGANGIQGLCCCHNSLLKRPTLFMW